MMDDKDDGKGAYPYKLRYTGQPLSNILGSSHNTYEPIFGLTTMAGMILQEPETEKIYGGRDRKARPRWYGSQ